MRSARGANGSVLPRELPHAERVAGIAASTRMREARQHWHDINALRSTRPIVFCDPENGWNEIITESQMQCRGRLARRWEMDLRKEIFWGEEMGDDWEEMVEEAVREEAEGGGEMDGMEDEGYTPPPAPAATEGHRQPQGPRQVNAPQADDRTDHNKTEVRKSETDFPNQHARDGFRSGALRRQQGGLGHFTPHRRSRRPPGTPRRRGCSSRPSKWAYTCRTNSRSSAVSTVQR